MGELCYPFIQLSPHTETVDDREKEIRELYKSFIIFLALQMAAMIVEYVSVQTIIKLVSQNFQSLSFARSMDYLKTLKHVNLMFKDGSWIQTTSDCSESVIGSMVILFNRPNCLILKSANDGEEVFTKSDILAASSNGVGICLQNINANHRSSG